MGMRLDEFEPSEVRRLIVGNYELRYELSGNLISIVMLWHVRENR